MTMRTNPAEAVRALGPGALTEDALRRHIFPLFARALAIPGIYLANHSLGRPLDQTEDDLREGFAHWQGKLGDAWDPWQEEEEAHRARLAQLIGAPRPDCIVPKTSAGQGLRTVLNALPHAAGEPPRVLSTASEFDSVDIILRQYAAVGRIDLELVNCHAADGRIDLAPLLSAIPGTALVIVSQVLFTTGQLIPHLDRLAAECHRSGARLLVDAYHAIGVFPVDVTAMQADFMIGGSYKYLRGGPGAAFLESTPPVLSYYQARAGQQLTLALGVDRIRAYSLDRLGRLKRYLAQAGIAVTGADEEHGGFLTLEDADAPSLARSLGQQGVMADARGRWLRLSPDYLTTDAQMHEAAATLAGLLAAQKLLAPGMPQH